MKLAYKLYQNSSKTFNGGRREVMSCVEGYRDNLTGMVIALLHGKLTRLSHKVVGKEDELPGKR